MENMRNSPEILKTSLLRDGICEIYFTFGPPGVSRSMLSAPAGLSHHSVLLWDTEELLPWTPWFSSALAQHRGVVVIRRHLAAGRLVGVAGGAALAQSEGLLRWQQVRTPGGWKQAWRRKKEEEGKMHTYMLHAWTHCEAFLLRR